MRQQGKNTFNDFTCRLYPMFVLCAVVLDPAAQTAGVDNDLIGITCVPAAFKAAEAVQLSAHF